MGTVLWRVSVVLASAEGSHDCGNEGLGMRDCRNEGLGMRDCRKDGL